MSHETTHICSFCPLKPGPKFNPVMASLTYWVTLIQPNSLSNEFIVVVEPTEKSWLTSAGHSRKPMQHMSPSYSKVEFTNLSCCGWKERMQVLEIKQNTSGVPLLTKAVSLTTHAFVGCPFPTGNAILCPAIKTLSALHLNTLAHQFLLQS